MVWSFGGYTTWGTNLIWYQLQRLNSVNVMASSTFDRNDDGSGSLARYKKKSFVWYKSVIESNGEALYK